MTDLVKVQNPIDAFQAQIVERLRNDIRELLPEQVLTDLVQRAVDETFFQERKVRQQYGNDIREASWFVAAVSKAAEPMLREEVRKFVEERKDVIQKAIDEFLTAERLTIFVGGQLSTMLGMQFQKFIDDLRMHR